MPIKRQKRAIYPAIIGVSVGIACWLISIYLIYY